MRTIYHLKLQDMQRDAAAIAHIVSETPFPRFEKGDKLIVQETQPNTWDVADSTTHIVHSADRTELHISTWLIVSSPIKREPISN